MVNEKLELPRQGVGVRLREHDEDFSGPFRQPSRRQRNRDRTEKAESHEYREDKFLAFMGLGGTLMLTVGVLLPAILVDAFAGIPPRVHCC